MGTAMIGALYEEGNGTIFRVWAPKRQTVSVLIEGKSYPLKPMERGYFEQFLPQALPGMDYLYELDGSIRTPDPASRWQPHGVHSPSRILNPYAYQWGDASFRPELQSGWIIYEMHIGTFTLEGTCASAIEKIPHLVSLGINAVEVMPLSSFPGSRNWGYDGVYPFAPQETYGGPEGFKAFVDA